MQQKSIQTVLIIRISIFLILIINAIAWGVNAYFKSQALGKAASTQVYIADVIEHALTGKISAMREELDSLAQEVKAARSNSSVLHVTGTGLFNRGIILLDASGTVVAGTVSAPVKTGSNFSNHLIYRKTISGHTEITADLDLSCSPPALVSTSLLTDSAGKITGILLGYSDMLQDNLLQALTIYEAPNNGYVYMVNSAGVMLFHPNKKRMFTTIPSGVNSGLDRAKKGFDGTLETVNSQGIRQLVTFTRVEDADIIIAVASSLDDVYRPIIAFRNYLFLFMLFVVATCVVVVRFIIRRVTGNLKQLNEYVLKAMPVGVTPDRHIEIAGDDEVATLAKSFNLLIDENKQYQAELETINMHLEEEVDIQTAHVESAKKHNELILHTVQEGIIGIDHTGRQMFINPSAARMLGYGQDEFLAHPACAFTLLHHTEAEGITACQSGSCSRYKSYLTSANNSVSDELYWRKDGSSFPVECSTSVIVDSYGENGFVVVFRDITDVRQAQQEQRKSEKRFAQLAEYSGYWVWEVDCDGLYTYCSPACLEIVGYAPEDLVGQKFFYELFPPEMCNELIISAYSAHLIDETVTHMQKPIIHRNGSTVILETTCLPVLDDSGNLLGYRGMDNDITQKTFNHQKLQTLSNAVTHSPAVTVITDPAGLIEYVNPKFTEVTGYLATEVIGQNPRILNSGTQEQAIYKELWETISAGREWSGELLNRKKNGELYWEHASISPIFDDAGKIIHFVAIKEDVSDQKRIAAELQRAVVAADTANTAKSDFLANMSHEIRTPLTAIIGFSDLALQTNQQSRQKEYIQTISVAGASLLHLVNDILDFSKIEAGELAIVATTFCLGDLLEDVISIVRRDAEDKGLNLVTQFPYGDTLFGDPHRLTQVITNLLSNAIKFTDAGEVDLVVTSQKQEDGRIKLLVSVRDTGIGISADKLESIFQPFTQADGSTSRKYGGTGLGLSISKRLVELMGGVMFCESEQGVGSTFTFTAWLDVGNHDDCHSADPGQLLRRNFTNTRILVADDNKINQELVVELLMETGSIVDVANNGKEAFEMIVRGDVTYDLVLMDLQMPEMDGYEATRLIRSDGRFAALPIVALTGNAVVEEIQRTKDSGMTDFLPKPYTIQVLLDTIGKYLGQPVSSLMSMVVRSEIESESLSSGLLDIPGLDCIKAMDRMDRDVKLYTSILQSFVEQHSNAAHLVGIALNGRNRELAERTAHSVKGNAGTIGATVLESVARQLENAIRTDEPIHVIEAFLVGFADELQHVIKGVEEYVRTRGEMDCVVRIDPTEVTPFLKRLMKYLADKDARAEHYLDAYEEALAGLPPKEVGTLRRHLAAFDFDAAQTALLVMAEKHGLVLDDLNGEVVAYEPG